MPNMAYPNQHIDIKIPHGWRDHVIIPDSVKITFNLDIESTDKSRSVVNNVGRALVSISFEPSNGAVAWFKRNWYD